MGAIWHGSEPSGRPLCADGLRIKLISALVVGTGGAVAALIFLWLNSGGIAVVNHPHESTAITISN
jgi:hypothetical protein